MSAKLARTGWFWAVRDGIGSREIQFGPAQTGTLSYGVAGHRQGLKSPPRTRSLVHAVDSCLQMEPAIGVISDRDLELLVDGSTVLGVRGLQDRDDPLELLDE
jgi:hypothetical protein